MSKKKPKISTKPQNEIKATKIAKIDKQLVVSYKYLDDNKKFSMDAVTNNRDKIKKEKNFREKMKEYCKHNNFKEKISNDVIYRTNNHIHPIDWKDNKIHESKFNSLNDELMEQVIDDCWQLGIDNQGFRIHGFFIDNVFYIVWLDPNHVLYERK